MYVKIFLATKELGRERFDYLFILNYTHEISLSAVEEGERQREKERERIYHATIHCTFTDDITRVINRNIVLRRRMRASRIELHRTDV